MPTDISWVLRIPCPCQGSNNSVHPDVAIVLLCQTLFWGLHIPYLPSSPLKTTVTWVLSTSHKWENGLGWKLKSPPRVPSCQRIHPAFRPALPARFCHPWPCPLSEKNIISFWSRNYKTSRTQHSSILYFTLETESCDDKLSCLMCWKSPQKFSTHTPVHCMLGQERLVDSLRSPHPTMQWCLD